MRCSLYVLMRQKAQWSLKVRDREGWGIKVSGKGRAQIWTGPHLEQKDSPLGKTLCGKSKGCWTDQLRGVAGSKSRQVLSSYDSPSSRTECQAPANKWQTLMTNPGRAPAVMTQTQCGKPATPRQPCSEQRKSSLSWSLRTKRRQPQPVLNLSPALLKPAVSTSKPRTFSHPSPPPQFHRFLARPHVWNAPRSSKPEHWRGDSQGSNFHGERFQWGQDGGRSFFLVLMQVLCVTRSQNVSRGLFHQMSP